MKKWEIFIQILHVIQQAIQINLNTVPPLEGIDISAASFLFPTPSNSFILGELIQLDIIIYIQLKPPILMVIIRLKKLCISEFVNIWNLMSRYLLARYQRCLELIPLPFQILSLLVNLLSWIQVYTSGKNHSYSIDF